MLHPRLVGVPPWMQANSVPERLTPRTTTVWPAPSTRWLPDTEMERGAVAAALEVRCVTREIETRPRRIRPDNRYQDRGLHFASIRLVPLWKGSCPDVTR